jgi:hypothetical protein
MGLNSVPFNQSVCTTLQHLNGQMVMLHVSAPRVVFEPVFVMFELYDAVSHM